MLWMKTVVREVYGLFVDDLSFAASILVWLGVIWCAHQLLANSCPSWVLVLLLFGGLATILFISALRFARNRPRS
jgi:hypothetical protein